MGKRWDDESPVRGGKLSRVRRREVLRLKPGRFARLLAHSGTVEGEWFPHRRKEESNGRVG